MLAKYRSVGNSCVVTLEYDKLVGGVHGLDLNTKYTKVF